MRKSIRRILLTSGLLPVLVTGSFGQDADPAPAATPKHVLWLIPNYRATPFPAEYEPLSLKDKMKVATEDSFDRGTFALAGVFAGISQVSNSETSFGQGAKGYAHRWATL